MAEQNKSQPPKKKGPRAPKVLANATGESFKLPEELVGLFGPVHRSAFDRELDQLIQETKAQATIPGGHPERVARAFKDRKAEGSLKNRAKEKGITLEILKTPQITELGFAFMARISPAQSQPKSAAPQAPQQAPEHQPHPEPLKST